MRCVPHAQQPPNPLAHRLPFSLTHLCYTHTFASTPHAGYLAVAEKFGFFLLYHFLYNLWNVLFGHVLGVLFSQQVAQNICSTLGFLLFSFMGLTRKPPGVKNGMPNEYAFLFWGL